MSASSETVTGFLVPVLAPISGQCVMSIMMSVILCRLSEPDVWDSLPEYLRDPRYPFTLLDAILKHTS